MELFQLLGKIAISGASEAKAEIESVSSSAGTTAERLNSFGEKATKAGTTLTKSITAPAIAAGTAVLAFATKTSSSLDTIDKMSQKIGVSREAYQQLDFICSQSGTSVDTFQMGMKTLTAAMDGAANGTKSNVEQFERLGISVTDANGNLRSQEEVMWETLSALQSMENQTEKARLATELFGRSGSELMPLLNGASGSIEEMKRQAEELGLVLSDDAVNAGVAFTDKMDQLKRAFTAAAIESGARLLPALTQLGDIIIQNGIPVVTSFCDALAGMFEWFVSLPSGVQSFLLSFVGIAVAAGPVLLAVGKVASAAGTVAGAFTRAMPIISGFAGSLSGVVRALAGNPFAIAIAGIVAVTAAFVFAYNSSETFRNAVDKVASTISSALGSALEAASPMLEQLGTAFAKVGSTLGHALADVGGALGGLAMSLVPAITQIISALTPVVAQIISTLTQLAAAVVPLIEGIISAIVPIVTAIVSAWSSIVEALTSVIAAIITAFSELIVAITPIIEVVAEAFANLVTAVAPVVEAIVSAFASLVEFLAPIVANIVSFIAGIIEAVAPVATSFADAFAAAVNAVENAISAIKGVIEGIKTFLSDAWEAIKDTASDALEGLVSILSSPFQSAWDIISGIVDSIKNAISSILDAASGVVSSVGSALGFGVKKHAKGGVMMRPTIFGYNPSSGNFHMGGEAGPEAIAPIDVLQGYVADAVAAQNGEIANAINNLAYSITNMDRNMGENLRNAIDGAKLSVNNREFARMVKGVT